MGPLLYFCCYLQVFSKAGEIGARSVKPLSCLLAPAANVPAVGLNGRLKGEPVAITVSVPALCIWAARRLIGLKFDKGQPNFGPYGGEAPCILGRP